MKRLHVHLSVKDLDQSIRFYSTLFDQQPIVRKSDYAKWMVDDPAVNFAISKRDREAGIEHLGLQVESDDELGTLQSRFSRADGAVLDEKGANCCYANSDKHWIADPQGVVWEAFHTHGEVATYGNSHGLNREACCQGQ